jgi:hypothetical protein
MSSERLIQVALKEVGTKESPPDSNKVKYNDWVYNRDGVQGSQYPWCAAFVSWCFNEAGIPLPRIDVVKGYVGCNFAVNNAAKWGKIVSEPKSGDIVFFDWNGDGKFDHTGIFVKDLTNGLFQSIEGNTSPANDSNGGEVMVRQRKFKNVVFIRPKVLG